MDKVPDRSDRWPRNRQRERVLGLVREHDGAVDVSMLAKLTGLHVTTVRFHLDALCAEGSLERTRINRPGVGRPRTGYVAVQGRIDYRSLAEVLALELGDTAEDRRQRAQRAGRRWAERITADTPADPAAAPQGDTDLLDSRTATTTAIFERMGFAPELLSGAGRQRTIRLHGCPVRELAREHPEVSCGIHLGLLQGLLNTEDQPGKATGLHGDLEPFVESELCIARVLAR